MFGEKINKFVESTFGKIPGDIYYYDASNRIELVKKYHNVKKEEMELTDYVDDITWEDLEMDQMFLRINHTNSFFGEQYLYHRLHCLHHTNEKYEESEKNKEDRLEKRLHYLEQNPKTRARIETKLCAIGKKDEDYYLPEFLKNTFLWKIGNTALFHILQLLLVISFAMIFVTNETAAMFPFFAMIGVNMIVYFKMKQKYEIYLNSLGVYKQLYDFSAWMLAENEKLKSDELYVPNEVKQSIFSLKKMSKLIFSYVGRKQNSVSGDLSSLVSDYIWGVTLLDISMFNHIMKHIENKQEDVMRILTFIGELDSDIAILSYRKSMEKWCKPQFVEEGIQSFGLVHPLLSNPVANDFTLEKRAIFTGANASGKSTFMKAIAINTILAQTIHTCTADQFLVKKVYVMTCMSLRDDIVSGESYYFREAKYIKRMIDCIDEKIPMLCVIDEILKGTNTVERINASSAILNYIVNDTAMVLIATHDRELTKNNEYKKYHFESKIKDGDVYFDYTLYNGICEDTNAIALLEVLGYPKSIVQQARIGLHK